jgi:glycosyltransferase involved in cell wall biosynthesis
VGDDLMSILVLVHEAGRTGSPISLLRTCRAMSSRHEVRFTFVVGRSGALLNDFRSLGDVVVAPYGRFEYWAERLAEKPATHGAASAALTRRRRYALRKALFAHDVVWCNGIVNGVLLADAHAAARAPVVCHVHELPRFLHRYTASSAVDATVRLTERWIACSQAVEEMLTTQFGVPVSRIVVVPEPLPSDFGYPADPVAGRRALHVDDDAVVVLASGTTDERKGADLLPQLAVALRETAEDDRIAVRWLGTEGDAGVRGLVEGDLAASGADHFSRIIPTVEDPRHAIAAADVFVLLSREDPYPLVLVEAVGMGVPGVAFTGSGGGPELLERGCGITVPYLDIQAMARTVTALARDPERRRLLGDRGKELAPLHAPHVVAEQVYECLCSAVAQ